LNTYGYDRRGAGEQRSRGAVFFISLQILYDGQSTGFDIRIKNFLNCGTFLRLQKTEILISFQQKLLV